MNFLMLLLLFFFDCRIYFDNVDSIERRNAQTVFYLTTECLKMILAPFIPYLIEEVEQNCKNYIEKPTCLERYSKFTLVRNRHNEINSDWLVLLHLIEQVWTNHYKFTNYLEHLSTLFYHLTSMHTKSTHPDVELRWPGSLTNPLGRICLHFELPKDSVQLKSIFEVNKVFICFKS